MTIRKALFTLSLALPLALAGCPSTEEGGSTVFPCSTNADCAADAEICHPVGKICVPTCTEASDCPDNQNECAAITVNGTALTTELVCQCKTGDAAFCTSEDTTVELVCSPVDNVCETKCATNDDCAAFTTFARECVNGICQAPALCTATSCTDPAASKCGADGKCAACTAAADCQHIAAGMVCNSGVCEIPACNSSNLVPGTNSGPDICAYAQTCTGGACVDIPAPTCSGAASHSWDKTKQGPVIVSAEATGNAKLLDCDASGVGLPGIEIVVQFYAPKGITFTTSATTQMTRIRMLAASGAEFEGWIKKGTTVPPAASKSGTFTAITCGTADPSGRAIFLKDENGNAGNAACLQ